MISWVTVNLPRAPTAEAWTTLCEIQKVSFGNNCREGDLPLWNTFTGKVSKCFDELGILEKHQSGAIGLV